MASTTPEVPIQPQSLGEVFLSAVDIAGPASYANPGGQVVSATKFAMLSGLRFVVAGISSDGLNTVYAVSPAGRASPTVVLRWFVTATGAEVANGVNLSTKTVRVTAIGN